MKTLKVGMVVICSLFLELNIVNALEHQYVNTQNVSMTLIEKESIEKLFGKDYVDLIKQDEFNLYKSYFQNPSEIAISYDNYLQTRAIDNKNLKFSKAIYGNSNLITLQINWTDYDKSGNYDVMGIRYDNINTTNFVSSIDSSSGEFQTQVHKNNGYASIIRLNKSANRIYAKLSFVAQGSGTIYGSYQHSNQDISLTDATNFNFSYNGLGRVFDFQKNYLFDGMNGVTISI